MGDLFGINVLGKYTSIAYLPSLASISAVIKILSLAAVVIAVSSLVVHTLDCFPLNTDISLTSPLLFSISNIIASKYLLLSYIVRFLNKISSEQFLI